MWSRFEAGERVLDEGVGVLEQCRGTAAAPLAVSSQTHSRAYLVGPFFLPLFPYVEYTQAAPLPLHLDRKSVV